MSGTLAGLLIGLLGGAGCWLIASAWARRRVTLVDRVAPYVATRSATSRLLREAADSPFPLAARVFAPLARDAGSFFETIGSTAASVRLRLRRAGRSGTVDGFRIEQVVWGAIGGVIGLVLALALAARGANPVLAVGVVVVAVFAGILARDQELTRAARARQTRLVEELPDVAELVALAVAAGESPLGALDRVAHLSAGDLAAELGDVVTRTRTGEPLSRVLEDVAATASSPELARFADAIAVALDRGTPLAEVLRAQARDVRENARARLMELGGTKEIGMMVPVVFLVLPITVMFALFPGLAALEVGL